MITRFLGLASLLFLLNGISFGAGFSIFEFSAQNNALGGAVMTSPSPDPAAMAVNPGLISRLPGYWAEAGATFIMPSGDVSVDNQHISAKDQNWVMPTFFATAQLSDNWFVGLGAYPRFGLGNEYENKSWIGSYSAYFVKLVSYSVTPTVTYKFSDQISIGASFEIMYMKFEQKKMQTAATEVEVKGDNVNYGASLGISLQPTEKLGIGTSYRLPVRQALTGDGIVRLSSTGTQLAKMDANGSITVPGQINFGVGYQLLEKLHMEVGLVGTFWSTYDELVINVGPNQNRSKKRWHDTVRVNLGASYELTDNWTLRGSYVYDQSPSDPSYMDVLVPVDNRHLISFGGGYKNERFFVDASFTILTSTDLEGQGVISTDGINDITVPMKYIGGKAFMTALSAGIRF